MSSDWIKLEKATADKPEVSMMAAILGLDPDTVLGKLVRVWSWFDTHTLDGNAPVTQIALLDRIVGVPGFMAAMQRAGWAMVIDGEILSIPGFERHMSKGAKTRALTKNRVNRSRSATRGALQVGAICNDDSVTSALPEIEVEIEDLHSHPPREGASDEAGQRETFPTREEIEAYAAKMGWNAVSARNFWLHHDAKRSQGAVYLENWHWWSSLEKWVVDDARGGFRQLGSGGQVVKFPQQQKPTTADYDRPDDWEDWQVQV